jgi:hypothetical protein
MSDLEKAAEEYWFKAKIFNPKKDSLETLAFKAGVMWERNRIAKAWPSSLDIENYLAPGKSESLFVKAWIACSSWLRERILGGAE